MGLPQLFRRNIGAFERMASGVAGVALLYKVGDDDRYSLLKKAVGAYLLIRGTSGYCILYDALERDRQDLKVHNVNIKTRIIVNRPRNEVYDFWRRLDNLPLFMKHLEDVSVIDELHSEWSVEMPGLPVKLKWTSEIVLDEINDRIGWQSLPGSSIKNAGNVHFRDYGAGTEVYVAISYAPAGKITEELGKVFSPLFRRMVIEDIASFKKYMESFGLQKAL